MFKLRNEPASESVLIGGRLPDVERSRIRICMFAENICGLTRGAFAIFLLLCSSLLISMETALAMPPPDTGKKLKLVSAALAPAGAINQTLTPHFSPGAATGLISQPVARTIGSCRWNHLDPMPLWTFSGVWAQDDDGVEDKEDPRLIIVDVKARALHFYPVTGGESVEIKLDLGSMREFRPALIQTVQEGGYLLESSDGYMLWLDPQLNIRKTLDLLAEAKNNKFSLKSLVTWSQLGHGEMIAFGDVQDGESLTWKGAFVRIDLDNPSDFVVLRSMGLDDRSRDFYHLGGSYITSSGDHGYILSMESFPALNFVDSAAGAIPGSASLVSMTRIEKPLGRRPRLPFNRGVSSVPRLYQEIQEAEDLVTNIIAWRNALFVVKRAFVPFDNSTKWSLVGMDLDNFVFSKEVVLPTAADHLTVIPGEQYWAFVEKSAVLSLGEQAIPYVLLIPSANVLEAMADLGVGETDICF